MLTSHQRVTKSLAFEEPDRIARQDAFWDDTLERWHHEGLPRDANLTDTFDLDFENIYLDASLRLPESLLEDTDEYTVRQDKHGFIGKQWKGRGGALGYLDQSIKTRADWEAHRDRLAVDFGAAARISKVSYFEPFVQWPTWEQMSRTFQEIRRRDRYILLHVYGPHEATWRKYGFEKTLAGMALESDFIAEMCRAHSELVVETLRLAESFGIRPDGLFVAEDLGINTGPMFSPKTYDKTLAESHHMIGDYCRDSDLTFFMHSDGDMRRFIPRLLDAGVQVLQPLEAKAGLDVRQLKQEYGDRLSFMGNIDVQTIAGSRAEMEEEVQSKLGVAMEGGGYIYHSDHSVPPSVSFENYGYLMELLDQYGSYETTKEME